MSKQLKRFCWITPAILVLAGAAVLFLDPSQIAIGHLRGESFYRQRPASYWRKNLRDTSPGVRTNTVKDLVDGGAAAVPVLIELLEEKAGNASEAAEMRWTAADALWQIGPEARAAIPQLILALKDSEPWVSALAADALGKIGENPEKVVPALRDMLRGDQRLAAIRAMRRFRAAAKDAIPDLFETIKDSDLEIRWNSAETIGDMGPAGAPGIDALMELVKDKEPKARWHACEALGEIGPAARRALTLLRAALKDEDAEVRREAEMAIKRIDPPGSPGR